MPMVSKIKWFEPRHMVNVTDRFTRDKTDSLQHAFFNGQGYATLDNLWGFWYGTIPHDAEAILRFTRIERAFAENLRSPDWEPHSQTLQTGVFASKFPTATNTLWTIVNRNEYDSTGEQLRAASQSWDALLRFVARHRVHTGGSEATKRLSASRSTAWASAQFSLQIRYPATGALKELLAFMAERSKSPLSSYSREWKAVPQTMVEIPATKAASRSTSGMVQIPESRLRLSGARHRD